ncbi:MAG: amidohydrolase family protein, partial [Niameybacter sp.]
LAVDGSASNDGSNLLEELRVAYLLHRLNSSAKAPSGYDILKLATRGSARLLGRNDIGQLKPQKACDLFMINQNRLELIGATYDPKNLLATVGFKQPVDYTIIQGQVISKAGILQSIDEEKVTYNAHNAVTTLLQKEG